MYATMALLVAVVACPAVAQTRRPPRPRPAGPAAPTASAPATQPTTTRATTAPAATQPATTAPKLVPISFNNAPLTGQWRNEFVYADGIAEKALANFSTVSGARPRSSSITKLPDVVNTRTRGAGLASTD